MKNREEINEIKNGKTIEKSKKTKADFLKG